MKTKSKIKPVRSPEYVRANRFLKAFCAPFAPKSPRPAPPLALVIASAVQMID